MSRNRMRFLVLGTAIWVAAGFSPGYAQAEMKPFVQKAEDDYAVYRLKGIYGESGYLGAKIRIERDGPNRIFRVTPGRKYRLKGIDVLGVKSIPMDNVLEGAPAAGEVYSAGRINDWHQSMWKKYGPPHGPFTHVEESASYDHEDASVSVFIRFHEGK